MKLIGNILWVIFGGLLVSAYYFIVGLLFCITIVGALSAISSSRWPVSLSGLSGMRCVRHPMTADAFQYS